MAASRRLQNKIKIIVIDSKTVERKLEKIKKKFEVDFLQNNLFTTNQSFRLFANCCCLPKMNVLIRIRLKQKLGFVANYTANANVIC